MKGAPYRIAPRAAGGGTLSVATGGKFANGAVTGAFLAALEENTGKAKPKDLILPGEEDQVREFAQREQQINALLANPSQENLELAVQQAAELYEIDLVNVRGGFHYRCHIDNRTAVARHDCMCVVVSDAAMVNVHQFASTLAHEVEVHIDRHFHGWSRLGLPRTNSRQWLLQEVEAYHHEISNR